jgi:hypothetical protein
LLSELELVKDVPDSTGETQTSPTTVPNNKSFICWPCELEEE